MMFRKQFNCLLLAVCAFTLLRPACAQIADADLPDLSGLAGAIEKATRSAPATQTKPPVSGTVYSSGLSVPSVHPGETAKDIVRQMREPIEKKTGPNAGLNKLEDAMPVLLTQIETYLPTQGLAQRDLGVAFGVFFVKNWETANNLTLSDPTEIKLIKVVSDNAAVKYKAKFSAMTPAVKERTYEQVLMTTMLVNTLTDAYTKAGKPTEEASFRKTAGVLFKTIVGVDADRVDISPDGKVTGPPTPSVSGGSTPPDDNTIPAGAMPADPAPPTTDTPPATDAPTPLEPGKPGAHALPPGHGVKPSQIAGVYAVQEIRLGLGGSFTQPFVPVLALKDGTYTEDFDVPPSDLDAADSRRRHSGDWGRWRYNAASSIGQWHGSAKHIQTLSKKGVWEAADWIGPLQGGTSGLRLSGICKAAGGGGSASSGFAYGFQQVYTFFPDGRYEYGQSVAVSSNNETGSVVGSSSTIRPKRGTYEVADYGLMLRGADGTVKRMSFSRTANGLVFMEGYPYTMENSRSISDNSR